MGAALNPFMFGMGGGLGGAGGGGGLGGIGGGGAQQTVANQVANNQMQTQLFQVLAQSTAEETNKQAQIQSFLSRERNVATLSNNVVSAFSQFAQSLGR